MAEQTPAFTIEKLYIKDISLEVPNAPDIFLENGAPETGIQIQIAPQHLADDVYESTLTVTVTAKLGEKTLFLIEVAQAGVFRLQNIPEEEIDPLLSIACPNVLFPYVREAVSDLASRAGFAPAILQPVNFEALYASRSQQQENSAAEEAPAVQTLQ
ncbi:MAG: protein-export chaperone SecB [Candidatus Accumulibacter sp.]|jgi:preprotein translocase subunit SecB|nr:protein-export chaperone SecB [Accumulibacter sp.]